MMATIFADASYCDQTGAAGWGAWFKRDDMISGEIIGGKVCMDVETNNSAELFAIAHALDACDRRGLFHAPCKTIMIQSDSRHALRLILRYVAHSRDAPHPDNSTLGSGIENIVAHGEAELAIGVIQDVCRRAQAVLLRHIHGHRAGGGRNWVNRQCDAIARRHMRSMREASHDAS